MREFWLGAENDRDGVSLRKEERDSGIETLRFGDVDTGSVRGRLNDRDGENPEEGSVRGISCRGAGCEKAREGSENALPPMRSVPRSTALESEGDIDSLLRSGGII